MWKHDERVSYTVHTLIKTLTSLIIKRILSNLIHKRGRSPPIFVGEHLVNTCLHIILWFYLIESEENIRYDEDIYIGGLI